MLGFAQHLVQCTPAIILACYCDREYVNTTTTAIITNHTHGHSSYQLNILQILLKLNRVFFLIPIITSGFFQSYQKNVLERITNKLSQEHKSVNNQIRFMILVTKIHVYQPKASYISQQKGYCENGK